MESRYRRRKKQKNRFLKKVNRIFITGLLALLVIKAGSTYLKKVLHEQVRDEGRNNNLLAAMDNIFNKEVGNDTQRALEAMAKDDKRVRKVLENYNDYPKELLALLSRNIEMLDFVLDFPDKKGKVYAEAVNDISKDTMPLLLQYDQRWGYGNYGDSFVAVSGCGPTALSMVAIKLTGNKEITPYKIASYAEENGYYVQDTGTSWSLFTEGSKEFGIEGRELPLARTNVFSALEAGNPIICSVKPGDFTTTGHIIVLTAIKNDKIMLHDPNSLTRSKELWDYERLEGQIKNLWVFISRQ